MYECGRSADVLHRFFFVRFLDTLDLGPWTLDLGPWTLDLGPSDLRTLDLGPWTLDLGPWTLDLGPWTLDLGPGPWTLDLGPWTLDLRPWTLDLGPWTLDLGPRTSDLRLRTWDLRHHLLHSHESMISLAICSARSANLKLSSSGRGWLCRAHWGPDLVWASVSPEVPTAIRLNLLAVTFPGAWNPYEDVAKR
jgi:hypothetical protein